MCKLLHSKITDLFSIRFGNLFSNGLSQQIVELFFAGDCQRIHVRPRLSE